MAGDFFIENQKVSWYIDFARENSLISAKKYAYV